MDKKIKAKWLKALRSGNYKQGKGKLRVKDGESDKFCCLGVLCSIIDPEPWMLPDNQGVYAYGHYEASLTRDARQIARIDEDACTRLSIMNDTGKTFAQIADYIESHL